MPAGLLSLIGAAVKLAGALMKFVSDRQLVSAGKEAGRAAAEAEHARAARAAEDEMRAIADQPATRDEVLKRLDEGTA